ncbi:ComEC/Rec2 family competence protein [Rhodohalobacter sp. 614A]|uniref:ComEC/Rec2 family competence protein n=1 Tax=Rhodohalobacter sp. 614A TaxID=2908649 RepID=UPI001F3DBCC2|nr:hypothetical protein [Rhodohalobacter sp. 614A]
MSNINENKRIMKKVILFLAGTILLIQSACSVNNKTDKRPVTPADSSSIPKTLPAWEEGYLDIHAINTGRGESSLLIFPDGTTMLIDAAGSLISPTHEIPPPPQKPNINVSPGQAITNYARHFIEPASKKLNYLMISHFDPDHMGSYSDDLPLDPTRNFRMGGITEVGAKITFDKILDRGYPDYNYPTDMTSTARITNYIHFIEWAESAYGATAEQFIAGRNDQITLMENPSKYENFEIRNVVSNGMVWTGTGSESVNTLPSGSNVDGVIGAENIFSLGFLLSYGDFNYFTAGDLQYNGRSTYPWRDIEAPVAEVVPAVDVMKANHHGTAHCNSDALLNSLTPKVVVAHTWRDVHPNPETISRIYAANNSCQIFSTNMTDANKSRLGDNIHRLKGLQGHVVVRVNPGGDEYYVYVLNDSDEKNYRVEKVYGPYSSK